MERQSSRALTLCLAASGAAAIIGGAGSRRAPSVYAQLRKPRWAPPAGVFAPVWSLLYLAMGVAAWRIWGSGRGRSTLAVHGAQLALNAAWPGVFFAARSRRWSLGVILALDALVGVETLAASRRDRLAAALLVPYLIWSLYATALTASITTS